MLVTWPAGIYIYLIEIGIPGRFSCEPHISVTELLQITILKTDKNFLINQINKKKILISVLLFKLFRLHLQKKYNILLGPPVLIIDVEVVVLSTLKIWDPLVK